MEQQNQQNQEPAQAEYPEAVQPETPPAPPQLPPSDHPLSADTPSVSQPAPPPLRGEKRVDFRSLTREARVKKREAQLEKLLAFVRERGRVANNDIQKLLRVSDATATRYARILVARNLLKKAGNTRGVWYGPVF